GGVAAAPAGRAVRGHQPQTVVLTQGLRVQTGELGRHRDDVDRSVLGQFIRVASTAVHLYQAPFAAWNRSARGSSSAVASRYASSASRAFPDRSPGTLTSTVTSRSPRVPSLRTAPLPRARMVRPLGVPGGRFSVTGGPPRVRTRTSPAGPASATARGPGPGGLPAGLARGALAAQPDALPVADARGNAHLHGPRGLGPAAALADVAGVLRDQPAALAVGARVGQGEAAPAAPRDLPGTDAGRAHAR